MSIRGLVNYIRKTNRTVSMSDFLNATDAVLALMEQDKYCLYSTSSNYGPLLRHLLDAFGANSNYKPAPFLVDPETDRFDYIGITCRVEPNQRIEQVLKITTFEDAVRAVRSSLNLTCLRGIDTCPYPVESLNGLVLYYEDRDLDKLINCVTKEVTDAFRAEQDAVQAEKAAISSMLVAAETMVHGDSLKRFQMVEAIRAYLKTL